MGIASVGHIERGPDGKDEYIIDRPGMSREEIISLFPPYPNSKEMLEFNRTQVIKAIMLEAYEETQTGYERERKNVRGFWYERLLGTLKTVLGDPGPQTSIDTTIGQCWEALVEDGSITYSGLNIYSKKSKEYHVAVREDSPYPTVVVLVEKEDFFEALYDLGDIYGISFVATGGHNSRCAAMDYVEQLRHRGIDLNQSFTIYSFCDFDPDGWTIPVGFVKHLQIKITAPIHLVRLGVLKEQISDSVLRYQASPYTSDAKTERARKIAETKYRNFMAETGGIFMPGTDVPAQVELDMYTGEQIRERIIEALAEHLDGFQYQVDKLEGVIEEEFDDAHDSALGSLMEEWEWEREPDPRLGEIEDEIDDLEREMVKRTAEENEELSDLFSRQREIERGDAERQSRLVARFEREKELLRQKYNGFAEKAGDRAANELAPVIERIGELEDIKYKKTTDLRSQRAALKEERSGIYHGESEIWSWQKQDYKDAINQWITGPGDVIISIEQDGGWRNWLEEVGIEEVDLEEAGQKREAIDWEPTWSDKGSIRKWLTSLLKMSAKW